MIKEIEVVQEHVGDKRTKCNLTILYRRVSKGGDFSSDKSWKKWWEPGSFTYMQYIHTVYFTGFNFGRLLYGFLRIDYILDLV